MVEPRAVRDRITPQSFVVAPQLIGLPLAGAGRRAAAMGVDLVVVALLVKAGGVFFGLTAAAILFRISRPSSQAGLLRRMTGTTLRVAGAVVLFVTIVSSWGFWRDDDGGDHDDAPAFTQSSVIGGGSEAADSVRALLATADPDSLARAYTAAVAADDTIGADTLRRHLLGALAADTLGEMDDRLRRLERHNDALAEEIEELEGAGILGFLRHASDDLGLGLGWFGLYFTAFLALWNGRTPGKRIFGLRVIRLDGKPMGWWAAFERFGGYAASISTGLLGFFEILWDRNRQGMHDKIAETVVVLEGPAAARRQAEAAWQAGTRPVTRP